VLFNRDIVDVTRWTGNVLKMLRGPLDRDLQEENVDGVASPPASSVGTTITPRMLTSPMVLNELA